MVWKTHVTVAAVAERDGRFLLVEETVSGVLTINQPAGHLEDGESLAEAVVRETREETAWRFDPTAVVGVYLWKKRHDKTVLRVCFAGSVHDHDPEQPLDSDIHRAIWRSHADLVRPQTNLRSPLVIRCIDDYLAGRRYPLDMVQHLAGETPRRRAV